MPTATPKMLTLYRYRLPLRLRFKHAAAAREVNEGLLVRLTLADGTVGLGEGIPRPYVTGETVETAIEAIRDTYAARLDSDDPLRAGPVPGDAPGMWHNAAWCACEMAYLDARARSAGVPLAEFLGRMLGRPVARTIRPRVAGVVGADSPTEIRRRIRLMRWFGLRDFKLKVGTPGDRENVAACAAALGARLAAGKVTLRVDANGAWSPDEALDACGWMKDLHVAAVEQPLAKGAEADLPDLRRRAGLAIMLDESLVDPDSAARLAEAGAADLWNLRVTKNAGLLATLRLADLARRHGIGLMLGCLVGESGILSAAARAVLQLVPDVRFVENSYGRFLLEEDLVRQSTQFGYGGKLRRLRGPGLGVTLRDGALERLAERVAQVPLA